jgi:hypothetical protein
MLFDDEIASAMFSHQVVPLSDLNSIIRKFAQISPFHPRAPISPLPNRERRPEVLPSVIFQRNLQIIV